MTRTEIVIVGGGPAGAAAAIVLARAGRRVLVLERAAAPCHKVCGEFLSGEAAATLRSLGVPPADVGAIPLAAVRLADDRRSVEAPLPFPAFAVSRLRMDAALLDAACRAGADVRTGITVREIRPAPSCAGAILRTGDGETIAAPLVLLATGKHDLRGWRRTAPIAAFARTVAWKAHLRLLPEAAAALGGRTELHLFPGGYAGLQPAEDGTTNFCLLVPADRDGGADQSFAAVLARFAAGPGPLARRLAGAVPAWPRALAIAGVPYGHFGPIADAHIWRLGDQGAVTPSLTGDGLAIALHSGRLAATAVLAGDGPEGYARSMRADVLPQVRRALLAQRVLASAPGRRIVLAATGLLPPLLSAAAAMTRLPVRQAG
jgi:menaquinone-9 beta-reductase